jgi:Protein affecting phage T7 exclusion by the F plasmid|tara:strand:- start:1296 stop:1712 length:417 start_codon:yes stop_codon:yes gene_type:complete
MNTALILIIFIPLIEIYLFIKIGAQIGAFNTVSLILITAIMGIYYARYEGLNTLKSAVSQLVSDKIPIYEILSGAALAIASLLLILPGFATDFIGLLLIIPITRKFFLKNLSTKYKQSYKSNDPIEGEYKDLDDKNGK